MYFTSDVSREAAAHAQRCGAETGQLGPLKAIGISALSESTIAEPVENDPATLHLAKFFREHMGQKFN